MGEGKPSRLSIKISKATVNFVITLVEAYKLILTSKIKKYRVGLDWTGIGLSGLVFDQQIRI